MEPPILCEKFERTRPPASENGDTASGTRKEIYCETCGSNQPLIEHEPQNDDLNPYPWFDLVCGTCYSVIATIQIVPEDKRVEPSSAVTHRPVLVSSRD